jgi:hypothetical protein
MTSEVTNLRSDKRLLLSFIFNNHVASHRIRLPPRVALKDVDFALVTDTMALLALITDEEATIDLSPFVRQQLTATRSKRAESAASAASTPAAHLSSRFSPFQFAFSHTRLAANVRELCFADLSAAEFTLAAFETLLFAMRAASSPPALEAVRTRFGIRAPVALHLSELVSRGIAALTGGGGGGAAAHKSPQSGALALLLSCNATMTVGSLGDRAAMLCVVLPTDFASLDLFVVWQRRQIALLVNAAVCVCLGDHDSVPDESHAPLVALRAAALHWIELNDSVRRSGFLSSVSFDERLVAFIRALVAALATCDAAKYGWRQAGLLSATLFECLAQSMLASVISSVSPFTGSVEAPSVAESPSGMPLGYARLADDFDDVEALLDAHVASYLGVSRHLFDMVYSRLMLHATEHLGERELHWRRTVRGIDRLVTEAARSAPHKKRRVRKLSASSSSTSGAAAAASAATPVAPADVVTIDTAIYAKRCAPLVRDILQHRLSHCFVDFANADAFQFAMATLIKLDLPPADEGGGDAAELAIVRKTVEAATSSWHRACWSSTAKSVAAFVHLVADADTLVRKTAHDFFSALPAKSKAVATHAVCSRLLRLTSDDLTAVLASGELTQIDRAAIDMATRTHSLHELLRKHVDGAQALDWASLLKPLCEQWAEASGVLVRQFAERAPRTETWHPLQAPVSLHCPSVVDLCGMIGQLLTVPSELAPIVPELAATTSRAFVAHLTTAVELYVTGALAVIGSSASSLPTSRNELASATDHAIHRVTTKLAPALGRRKSAALAKAAPRHSAGPHVHGHAHSSELAPVRTMLERQWCVANSLLWFGTGLDQCCLSAANHMRELRGGSSGSADATVEHWRALLEHARTAARRAPRLALRAIAVHVVFDRGQPLRRALDELWRNDASSVRQVLLPSLDAALEALHDPALDSRLYTPLDSWMMAAVLGGVWHAMLFGGREFALDDSEFLVDEVGVLETFFEQGLPAQQVQHAVRPLRTLAATVFAASVADLAHVLQSPPPATASRSPFTKRNVAAVLLTRQHDKEVRHLLKHHRREFDIVLAPAVVLTWIFDADACADVTVTAEHDSLDGQLAVVVRALQESQGNFSTN